MFLTTIDPETNWIEIVELVVVEVSTIPTDTQGYKGISIQNAPKAPWFSKSSAMISTLVNETWFHWYPYYKHIIYDNGGEFKFQFKARYDTYGFKCK
jgi:hypothetical protein